MKPCYLTERSKIELRKRSMAIYIKECNKICNVDISSIFEQYNFISVIIYDEDYHKIVNLIYNHDEIALENGDQYKYDSHILYVYYKH